MFGIPLYFGMRGNTLNWAIGFIAGLDFLYILPPFSYLLTGKTRERAH